MAALIRQLALVSESAKVGSGEVMKVAAALQKQAARDLAPIWEISATVDAFGRLEDVPLGYWPLIVRDDIQERGAAGIHKDKDGQPFALIAAGADLDSWALTASHEALEMLVDSFGSRLIPGDSPAQGQGRANFLVEVCDPSEGTQFGYSVNGLPVSDFYTPRYFDPVAAPGVRYSFTGEIMAPREILEGGYLSWHEPTSDHWFQLTWFDGSGPRVRDIGRIDQKSESLRAQIDRIAGADSRKAMSGGRETMTGAGLTSASIAPRVPEQGRQAAWANPGYTRNGPWQGSRAGQFAPWSPTQAALSGRPRMTAQERKQPPTVEGLRELRWPMSKENLSNTAEVARTAKLREQIGRIEADTPESRPPTAKDKPAKPLSPRDFIQQRMRELDRKT